MCDPFSVFLASIFVVPGTIVMHNVIKYREQQKIQQKLAQENYSKLKQKRQEYIMAKQKWHDELLLYKNHEKKEYKKANRCFWYSRISLEHIKDAWLPPIVIRDSDEETYLYLLMFRGCMESTYEGQM